MTEEEQAILTDKGPDHWRTGVCAVIDHQRRIWLRPLGAERTMTATWEPPCTLTSGHFFVVKQSVQVWTTSGTATNPPPDAPLYQRESCAYCGFTRDRYVPNHKENAHE